ncbi:MAG: nicotinate-nucleotide adenylyltransferase [Gammaproteobacteria bacterium]|nr:nicotinate-nucleotide adenylyltransferase [Gammaproteobacteria bacterium]
MNKPIGIFGGTFDPVHFGHLRIASEILTKIGLEKLHFVPCAIPALKSAAHASSDLRVRMLNAAIEGYPAYSLDERELHRQGVSYTIETLLEMRQEQPNTPFCLILGMDAWLSFPQWHRWQDILELTHVVVANRPGIRLPEQGQLNDLLQQRQTTETAELHQQLAGRIFVHEVTQLEISSSTIRKLIANGLGADFLLPPEVGELIHHSGCYSSGSSIQ